MEYPTEEKCRKPLAVVLTPTLQQHQHWSWCQCCNLFCSRKCHESYLNVIQRTEKLDSNRKLVILSMPDKIELFIAKLSHQNKIGA